jgi:3-methyladenine DNA glycosylase AlkD
MSAKTEIINYLKSLSNEQNKEGQARFGINTEKSFGINIPVLRNLAKQYKKQHELALQLWSTGYHEARILAVFIDDYRQVTEQQMEAWAADFNSWDLCDQCCGNLFDKTPFTYDKATAWAAREEEFVRRAGFTLMATLAVHDKKAPDEKFFHFFSLIEQFAFDERNFVKKAVNWALRQMGKRSLVLHKKATATAEKLLLQKHKSARWIATDALRELDSEKVLAKFN